MYVPSAAADMEKYTCTPQNVKATLNEFGVAIVENVLDAAQCDDLLNGMWATLTQISRAWPTPIVKENPVTWKGIYELAPLHSMLLQHWQIGHAQAIWNVRQNAKCIEVFQQLWCSSNLLVSFDGCAFAMPPEITNRGWNRDNTWYHTDQSYTTPEFLCVQSWVTALDVHEGDATLSFFEKSHLYHADFAESFGVTDKRDWYKLGKEQEAFYVDEKKCAITKITCPKGSMVLWDSRTVHCGVEALKTRAAPNLRCVAYLCYMPRSLSTPRGILKKRKAFEELRMTTHNPCAPKLFAKHPRTYGKALPAITAIDSPVLTDVGLALAGF